MWHNIALNDVLAELGTSSDGISITEATQRLEKYGLNRIEEQERVKPIKLLMEQFKNVLIITLLIATVISAFLGHEVEAIAIAVIVLFAVILGFIQELKAEKAIEALRKMAAPNAKVIRGGKELIIPAHELVPGDVFLLSSGDRIPADARLIESVNLKIDEASLTGESLASEKDSGAVPDEKASLGDRVNMVFAGTAVRYGRGTAAAVETGMKTEFGKIAKMLQTVETERTPLQKNLDKVGAMLARAAIVIVFIIVILGLFRGQPFIEMLIFGVALAVAVVPEALPAVVTISLALGVQRMAKRHALMRRLPAVETLGSTTVICSDKTGTLTRDEMTVRAVYTSGVLINVSGSGYKPEGEFSPVNKKENLPSSLKDLLIGSALCNDSKLVKNEEGEWDINGDPTEGALIVAARKAGIDEKEISQKYGRIAEKPFSSETKRMITLHEFGNVKRAFIKGAPEVIVPGCSGIAEGESVASFGEQAKEEIIKHAGNMASHALRVLAVAYKDCSTVEEADTEMTLLGFVGMIDPPRPEAKAAVTKCLNAGIRPIMITGDHPETAQAIARELGILDKGRVVTGKTLQEMDNETLRREIAGIQVFARVSPEHKLRIIEALQKNGHIVAMTGDGVNDAPALKKADIGISMGITGTDVTKEASAMMLTDDNFASIVAAVEEGRGIYDNIKKYLTYLLSSNIGEIGLMSIATLFGMPLPLSAVQILYVNLATDGLPALALAVDPADKNIMLQKPNNPKKGIFTKPIVSLMLIAGIWASIANISLFAWALNSGRSISESMSMAFVSLVLIQFFNAYNFRSHKKSAFVSPFANKWLNIAIIWEILLLIAVVYTPFLQKPFGTFSLTRADWEIIAATAFTIVPVVEIAKIIIKRGWFGLKE